MTLHLVIDSQGSLDLGFQQLAAVTWCHLHLLLFVTVLWSREDLLLPLLVSVFHENLDTQQK